MTILRLIIVPVLLFSDPIIYSGDAMCLANNINNNNNNNHALVNGVLSQRMPYNFPFVPEAHFAEQLTRMDMVRTLSPTFIVALASKVSLPRAHMEYV